MSILERSSFLQTVIKNIATVGENGYESRQTLKLKTMVLFSSLCWKLRDRAQSFVFFCSQVVTEYSLFTDSIFSSKSTQLKGVVVGEEKNTSLFFFLTLRARCRMLASLTSFPMFLKRMKRKLRQHLCTG